MKSLIRTMLFINLVFTLAAFFGSVICASSGVAVAAWWLLILTLVFVANVVALSGKAS